MPRDGSNQYFQPSPDVVPDTTIESAVYNAFVGDVVQDLNHPRPIIAGGTGAINADAALINLKAEKAGQAVTNYDSHVWVAGSFYSAVGATGAPDCIGSAPSAFAYVGTAMIGATAATMVLEARNVSTLEEPEDPEEPAIALDYIREKKDGVWGAWFSPIGTLEADKVAKSGDTMTGDLFIAKASPALVLAKATATEHAGIFGRLLDSPRWFISLGTSTAEAGGNVGSDFTVYRYDNAGELLGFGMSIERANGNAAFPANVQANTISTSGGINAGAGLAVIGQIDSSGNIIAAGDLYARGANVLFGSGTGQYILRTGSTWQTDLGSLWHSGNLNPTALAYLPTAGGTVTGAVSFASTTTFSVGPSVFVTGAPAVVNTTVAGVRHWQAGCQVDGSWRLTDVSNSRDRIYFDTGTGVSFNGDALGGIAAMTVTGRVGAGGYRTKAGEGAALGANVFNIHWTGSNARLWIDNSDLGTIYTTALDDPIAALTDKLEKALARIEALEARQPKDH